MDRGGWKLGKLERLGQPEDWKLEDCEYGSLDHLEAGDRERQPAEGGGGGIPAEKSLWLHERRSPYDLFTYCFLLASRERGPSG